MPSQIAKPPLEYATMPGVDGNDCTDGEKGTFFDPLDTNFNFVI